MPSFKDQYWDLLSHGSRARTELAKEHYTEYSAFTGSDIKAFILPQGDQLARKEAERRLTSLSEALADQQSEIDRSAILGTFEETVTVGASADDRGQASDIMPLVNLQSLTISTYRAKSQVRALGHVNAVGLARGSRTVAGTFILTEFSKDAFWDVLTAPYRDINVGDTAPVTADQMRPFDIMLLFAHEMGNIAIRHLWGVEIVTNGVVYSIQDYYSENTVSYIAHEVSPLIPLAPAFKEESKFSDLRASQLKLSNLITSVRAGTLPERFDYLRKVRNPFR